MESQGKALAEVQWDYAADHRVISCTGAVGGLTPAGDLRMDVYIELGITVDQAKVQVIQSEEGKIEEVPIHPDIPRNIRQIQASLVIPGTAIKSFSDWFRDQVEGRSAWEGARNRANGAATES